MGFSFGNKSSTLLSSCENSLVRAAEMAILHSEVDFSITEGHRTVERQFELYKKGREEIDGVWKIVDRSDIRTGIDGKNKRGNHNYMPSRAFDICIYFPGKPRLAYDREHLTYVAGVIMACASILQKDGDIDGKIFWGANWDGDGEILYDHTLWDRPHFEVRGLE